MKIETESVVVGAGPVGIFQIFELGLLGISCHVVDSLRIIGGQCSVLYADKPIYDIPGYPIIGAQELIDSLVKQAEPFSPEYHLGAPVTHVVRRGDGRFDLATGDGTEFDAGSVIIAGGLGAFDARPLRVRGASDYEGKNLNYKVVDKSSYAGKKVVILGGGDSALDWALELHKIAKEVVLVHRREAFRAQPASVEKLKSIAEQKDGTLSYHIGRIEHIDGDGERLSGIQVVPFDASLEAVDIDLDELLVFYGLSPNLGPIADWGLEITKKAINVRTEDSQTSIPGIFAIGDIVEYPGKKNLILCGFHEAAMAAFGVQHYLYPEVKQRVQFTTTSPALHDRLGVDGKL